MIPSNIAFSLGISLVICVLILGISWYFFHRMKKRSIKKEVPLELPDIILLYIFTLACLLPFASYAAILFAKYYLSSFLVIEGETSDWFLVIGSIFTGFITMSAVIFTKISSQKESDKQLELMRKQLSEMKEQNTMTQRQFEMELEIREREVALQTIPLLKVILSPSDSISGFSVLDDPKIIEKEYPSKHEIHLVMEIKNLSNYIARSLNFVSFEITRSYNEGFADNEQFVNYQPQHISLLNEANYYIRSLSALPGGYTETRNLFIPIELNKLSTMNIVCELEYKDYKNVLTHRVRTSSEFSIKIDKKHETDIEDGKKIKKLSTQFIIKKQGENYSLIE